MFEPHKVVTREEYAQFIFNGMKFENGINNKLAAVQETDKEHERITDEMKKLENTISGVKKQLTDLTKTNITVQELEKELSRLSGKKNELSNELAAVQETDKERQRITDEIKRLEDTISGVKKQLTDFIKTNVKVQELKKSYRDCLERKMN
ncbi:hypothetical protein ACTIGL_28165 (plasmid) [Bacillus shihchuchen]|uniref:Uncharacterized protein n=1 Tax=Bacillus shihchuchen TaxID=3036942 RepID=A0ABT7L235_9BACI|nr:hypothetical protein [Bacillus shihchuchen]